MAQIFPALKQSVASLHGLIPGRYWKAWDLPSDATELDKRIQDLICSSGSSKILRKNTLLEKGVECPFYSWRVSAVWAFFNASRAYRQLHSIRRLQIESEIKKWGARIDLAKGIIKSHLEVEEYIGSVYMDDTDFYDESIAEMAQSRNGNISRLHSEIAQETLIKEGLEYQLNRINSAIRNNKTLDVWKNAFVMYMGCQWQHTVDEGPKDRGIEFQKILFDTTTVVGGKFGIEEWGQTRTLHKKFKEAPSGHGFRRGEAGFLDQGVAFRGEEAGILVDYHTRSKGKSNSVHPITSATLLLADYTDGSLSYVMRNVLLRNMLIKEELFTERTAIQIGWLESNKNKIIIDLDKAISRAKSGDIYAATVVQATYEFDEDIRRYLEDKGWSKPFGRFSIEDILFEYNGFSPIDKQEISDYRAFQAAFILIIELKLKPKLASGS